jgi:citrate lyase beta subunit
MRAELDIDVSRLADELDQRLARADAALAAQFPGERPGRQPIHTVYVPADRYRVTLGRDWGAEALAALDAHRPTFAALVGEQGAEPDDIEDRVRRKLTAEPIEDLRIDFEDGYGTRGDEVEDRHAAQAARELATSVDEDTAPPFFGIRMKSLEAPTRRRAVRTLVAVVDELVAAQVPLDRFVITLPKATSVDQITAMVHLCTQLERATSLDEGALRFEIQVETPQAILGPDGPALVAPMLHAAGGRCTALHYGTYDYSAFCGIAAEYQSMAHPVADHAKLVMQAAAAGTGVRLSDGSTNVLPVGSEEAVRDAWRLHLGLVRRSLERGYYQGWDLHPAQLPTRYAATFGFYRDGLPRAAMRLRHYVGRTASGVLDEPATGRALSDYLLRAVHCGAVDPPELEQRTGLSVEAITGLARPGR